MSRLIDVVVPVRNAAEHLPTFLASVEANCPEGCRYLVVEDASDDATAELLDRAAAAVPALSVIRHDRPAGVASARNTALQRVDARYLAFADVDDWMAPGRLSHLIEAQRRTGAAVLRTDFVRVNRFRRVPETAPEARRDTAFPAVEGIGDAGGRTLVDYPFLWAGLFDTEQLPPLDQLHFDPALRTASDRPWFWRLHQMDVSVAVVTSPSYFYRREPGQNSLTETPGERLLDIVPSMHQVLDLAGGSGLASHRRRAAYTAILMVCLHINRRGRLDPRTQDELVLRSAGLLARIDDNDFANALAHLRPEQAELARLLHEAGRRWAT